MEGSIPLKGHETLETRSSKRQKEGVPQSLDFEPQLFVNDVLNAVDECIEEGFEYFERQALNCLPKGSQVSKEIISKAVNDLHGFVQKKADKRLSVWERFCLEYCFKVADEAAFPNCTNTKLCGTEILHKVEHSDEELDSRLKSLHKQLEIAQNESIDLHNEVWMLERQREKRTKVVKALAEALGPLEDSSAADIHQEIVRTVSEIYERIDDLVAERRQNVEASRLQRMMHPIIDYGDIEHTKGFHSSFEDLQHFAKIIKARSP
eukprot:TRINITY_DN2445_c0_g1_i1.p1 TRINITY_DN2445_c0_g1~~TRINITY_DN2445_c0_g1_i1.p1  ORF type:complete len:264 (+),score=70.49 TRINITY_DN2445_c0_g1_i1:229-1020(+)